MDHANTDTAYAWSGELEGGRRRFFAVLKIGPIQSPADAMRVVIVKRFRDQSQQ
ncbi:MAG: hypothetical protein AB7K09_11390 [Planctomycetota bacterium]